MYLSLSVLILYFFLNTYNTIAIATSWSVAPIEITSELIPLNVALSTSKTNDIDLNIDMPSILAKVNVPVPLSIDIVFFFLNTYNTVAIATSWSVSPIETMSEMIPLNVALATSKTSVFPPPRVSLP
jgi:hypothetical protein